MPKNNVFSNLTIPTVTVADDSNGKGYYLVYSDASNFVKIEAETAFEAVTKSGIEKPVKIIHKFKSVETIVNIDERNSKKKNSK